MIENKGYMLVMQKDGQCEILNRDGSPVAPEVASAHLQALLVAGADINIPQEFEKEIGEAGITKDKIRQGLIDAAKRRLN